MFIGLLGQVDPDLDFRVYDVEQGEYPDDIDEVDAYLITGSKSSVYDDKPWIAALMEFVRELDRRRKKLVGFFVGQVMKLSKGQANPQMVNQLLAKKLV